MKRLFSLLLAVTVLAFCLFSCNDTEGVSSDVSSGESTASDVVSDVSDFSDTSGDVSETVSLPPVECAQWGIKELFSIPYGDEEGQVSAYLDNPYGQEGKGPQSFYVDEDGNINVLDMLSNRICVFDEEGNYLKQVEFALKPEIKEGYKQYPLLVTKKGDSYTVLAVSDPGFTPGADQYHEYFLVVIDENGEQRLYDFEKYISIYQIDASFMYYEGDKLIIRGTMSTVWTVTFTEDGISTERDLSRTQPDIDLENPVYAAVDLDGNRVELDVEGVLLTVWKLLGYDAEGNLYVEYMSRPSKDVIYWVVGRVDRYGRWTGKHVTEGYENVNLEINHTAYRYSCLSSDGRLYGMHSRTDALYICELVIE